MSITLDLSGWNILGQPGVEVTGTAIRALERTSIRDFMAAHRQYLRGRVLDYGAGKQPYKDLVEGVYVAWDPAYSSLHIDKMEDASFDAVMCNQVIQYEITPPLIFSNCSRVLKSGGYLVMTYPTNWDEVANDDDDYFRFTKKGIEYLLIDDHFHILHHTLRASISFPGFSFPLGYGVVAQRL